MAKKKVFVSFEFDRDLQLKSSLLGQSRQQDSPFAITDFSLQEKQVEATWYREAQRRIDKCDIFVVILGRDTHNAQGVLREVSVARGLAKRRFQLRPQGKNWAPIEGAGDVVTWKWKYLKEQFA